MEWISVKHTLPQFGELVLVYSKEEDTYCATLFGTSNNGRYFDDWKINCCCADCQGGYIFEVTHWMPIPQQPKESQ